MKISIIIVNKNDRGVNNTLAELIKIKNPEPYEIIVVDASAGKLNDIKLSYPTVKWYDFKQSNSKQRTIPDQRNYGIAQSHGEIVVFIDANCIPEQNWLQNLTSPITSNNEMIVAGSYGSKDGKTIHDSENRSRSGVEYLDECPTMNAAFSKKVFDSIGTFDEVMGVGEDVDLCWRAKSVGYKIKYAEKAKIIHDWGNQKEDFSRAFRYGYARTRLYLKHPDNWRNILKNEKVALVYPVYLLGLPITLYFWPYPLLILIPAIKNINNSPIKKVSYQLVYAFGVFRGLVA
jgi:cellulose synthase/poly-beta-1,6-N-acetylglucosamine synthase-like glycosyltransferase